MSRKKAEAFIIQYIDKLDPTGENKKIYQAQFLGILHHFF